MVAEETNKSELLETYCKQIRPLVKLAVPYWGNRVTKHEVTILERVQKTALHIIDGENYTFYEVCEEEKKKLTQGANNSF